LQTYRWTLTMALSIVHRATGMALYFGTLLLAWWLIAAAPARRLRQCAGLHRQHHRQADRVRLHMGAAASSVQGLRHFVWDLGYGFKPMSARA
jgi:succinate dehydrogenase / fumarate reductase cytochrome b subunit